MKLMMLFLITCCSVIVNAQTLTVDHIMEDVKWRGTSPSNVYWSIDNKTIYFSWNPDKNISDSVYKCGVDNKAISKVNYWDAQLASAISNGSYNTKYTHLVYTYQGDLFLLDITSGKTIRITKTEDDESGAVFAHNDEWIVYNLNENLYAFNIKAGTTQQLTNFTNAEAGTSKAKPGQLELWVQNDELQTSDVVKLRKQKRDARDSFLKANKQTDTLKIIRTGGKDLRNVKINPNARYVTYSLYQPATDAQKTIVPDYVTQSGFTADIPGRTMVGAPQGKYEYYVYDRQKDTVLLIKTDSLPGITDQPDYVKDYPAKFKDKKAPVRDVIVDDIYWNQKGNIAVIDIRSLDNKDRWIMQLDTATAKLKLLDRQRDEAWIGGPGIGWSGGGSMGFINDHTFYYQSEISGYSHLYTCDVNTGTKTQLTKGNYEIQQLTLSRNKQYFYIISNEEHPGKQNFYRLKTDGSAKEKITPMTGGYQVSLSPDEKKIAYLYSYQTKPWELFVQENTAGKTPVQLTDKAMSDTFKMYPWRDTKIFTFTARDGKEVYARIYEPAAGKKNNAAVIFVHGAGYLQNVHYGWSNYFRECMFNNLLADKGYTVMDIDYRASSGYGRDWRTAIYRYMGGKDLDDEVDAAHYMVKQLGIDSTRIGMYGGSYGGFMTLMALFTQPTVFKAGAALRPVTDWAHYNDSYTSAILNEPYNDSLAYQRSSPINFAAGLQNHLLICHGMVDVNVHFQDAVRLNQRLIELKKDNWQMAVYPVEDHGFVEPSSWTDEYKRILHLFDEQLLK